MDCSEPYTVGLTHVARCLIASFTESLRSFNSFPFNPRLRAVQTSAQANPRSTQSASLVIDSCTLSISLQSTNATQEGIDFDHSEDNAEGAENGLGRRNAAEFLRKVRGLDGHIERGDDNISTFLSLIEIVGFHVLDVARENVVCRQDARKIPIPDRRERQSSRRIAQISTPGRVRCLA